MEENLKRNIVNKIFDMQETEICHNPYDHERRKLFSIESGDLRQLRRCQREKYEGKLGRERKARNGITERYFKSN